MEEDEKNSANSSDDNRRLPFTVVDWIIAVFSIALMVFILLNIPAY